MHHWVLKNLPSQFVASHESLWNAHSVDLASTSAYEVNYRVLVESSKGPEVIEHKNTIAMQLHIDKAYESTITLLQNFVNHNILLIQEHGRTHLMIEEGEDLMKTMMYTKGPNSNKMKSLVKFRHNKHNKENIEDIKKTNSVRKEGIRPTTAKSGHTTLSARALTTRASSRARLITSERKSRIQSRQVRLFNQ
jgi:hypothetical protein